MAFSQAGEPLFTLCQTVTPAEYAEAGAAGGAPPFVDGPARRARRESAGCAPPCAFRPPRFPCGNTAPCGCRCSLPSVSLLLGCGSCCAQPVRRLRELERRFAGSPVLCEETKIDCCRDCVVLQTSLRGDPDLLDGVSACVEGGSFTALSGGAWRQLLVLKRGQPPGGAARSGSPSFCATPSASPPITRKEGGDPVDEPIDRASTPFPASRP